MGKRKGYEAVLVTAVLRICVIFIPFLASRLGTDKRVVKALFALWLVDGLLYFFQDVLSALVPPPIDVDWLMHVLTVQTYYGYHIAMLCLVLGCFCMRHTPLKRQLRWLGAMAALSYVVMYFILAPRFGRRDGFQTIAVLSFIPMYAVLLWICYDRWHYDPIQEEVEALGS